MNNETTPVGETLPTNPAVTRERVVATLEAAGWRVGQDDDGDVYGVWDGHLFYFFLTGDKRSVLQVRGRYAGSVPLEEQAAVLPFLDTFNRDHVWPKVYSRTDTRATGIYTEVSTDLTHGVADDQLAQLLTGGLATGIQFFAMLAEAFPAWAPADAG